MGFLITLFGRRDKSSSSVAKDRLLEVLIHDRVKLSPATMEQIRKEILEVLSKYVDVDPEAMDVSITRADGTAQLHAHIPIRRGETFNVMEADAVPGEQPPEDRHAARPGATPHSMGPQRKRRH